MICRACSSAADHAAELGAAWSRSKHATCLGCDCQHRVRADIPESMAELGTPENGRLVGIAVGIELSDLEARRRDEGDGHRRGSAR
jgi:hypothetical protein